MVRVPPSSRVAAPAIPKPPGVMAYSYACPRCDLILNDGVAYTFCPACDARVDWVDLRLPVWCCATCDAMINEARAERPWCTDCRRPMNEIHTWERPPAPKHLAEGARLSEKISSFFESARRFGLLRGLDPHTVIARARSFVALVCHRLHASVGADSVGTRRLDSRERRCVLSRAARAHWRSSDEDHPRHRACHRSGAASPRLPSDTWANGQRLLQSLAKERSAGGKADACLGRYRSGSPRLSQSHREIAPREVVLGDTQKMRNHLDGAVLSERLGGNQCRRHRPFHESTAKGSPCRRRCSGSRTGGWSAPARVSRATDDDDWCRLPSHHGKKNHTAHRGYRRSLLLRAPGRGALANQKQRSPRGRCHSGTGELTLHARSRRAVWPAFVDLTDVPDPDVEEPGCAIGVGRVVEVLNEPRAQFTER